MISRYFRAALPAALLLSAPAVTAAQSGVVSGVVADSAGRPLSAVTVAIQSGAARVASGRSGADGAFRIAGVAPGRYTLLASLLGYATHRATEVVVPAGGGAVQVGTVRLRPAPLLLQELTVSTERSNVGVAADRNIYTTRDMPVSSGGVATDVLRSVPELEVDVEGGVQLRGTSAQIHVNGRPAAMSGEALQLFLQQLPADRIDRVEVMANPSARYEAEGAGGIVNVVLKKDVELGTSGSVFATGGTRGEAGLGGRVSRQRGALSLSGAGFLRRSSRSTSSYDLRQNLLADPTTFLRQDSGGDRDALAGSLEGSAELRLGERWTTWAEASLFRSGFDADALTVYTRMDEALDPVSRFDRLSVDRGRQLSFDGTLGLRRTFGGDDHELTLEVDAELGDEDERRRIVRRALALTGSEADPTDLTLEDVEEGEREVALELDYVRPWGQGGKIEAGYRARLADTDEERAGAVHPGGQEGAAPELDVTGYDLRERVHSAYVTLARGFGPLLVQGGLRAEHASLRLEPLEGGTVERSHPDLFPSANLRYDLGGGREVRLSYARRIRRPRAWVLSPVNRSSDPLTRVVGNPELQPQDVHSVTFEAGWSGALGSLRLSPYYRRTVDEWTQIRRVDAQGVSTRTWDNLASVDAYGSSVTASLRPTRGISGHVSVSGAREVRHGGDLSVADASGTSMRWNVRGNVSARASRTLALQGMMFWSPARDVPQGRVSSMLMTHVGARQQLLGERLTVNLMVTDPLDLQRTSFEARDPTFLQVGRSSFRARSGVLTLTYTFGRAARARDRDPSRDRPDDEPQQEPEEPMLTP